jgi:hypothetical protein
MQSTNSLWVVAADDIAYATRISRTGSQRLCAAAGIEPPEWEDREFPEPDTREQTRQLTGLDFDDLIKDQDILSRRPYLCAVCGGTFTVGQFRRVKWLARRNGEPDPFGTEDGAQTHEACGQ